MKKLFIISLICAASGTTALFGQQSKWKEANNNGYSYKYVDNDPTNARFYTLNNKLTVILSPNKKEPRVQTYVSVKAGSKTDPATHTGLAHYLEHMLFKGTDKFGSLDWEKEKVYLDIIDSLYEKYNQTTDVAARNTIYRQIDSVSGIAAKYAIPNEYDKIMAAMGGKGTNAWTSFEETVYTEDVPSNAINKYLALQSERFRNPILRIFHTELEAVYEEKNRSLDSDNSKAFETLFLNLFPNHNYGLQTTIGTIDHLKNPSLVEIRKYFETYYVPNNMAIVLSGDFDPDEVIKEIDKYFGSMQAKVVPPYTFVKEQPITAPIEKSVVGPSPEFLMMAYRFPGASDKDARILELVGKLLANGTAGMIDINLVQEQKLLGAYAFTYLLKDYSSLILQGMPGKGQTLAEVRALLLAEIEKLKKGEFTESLLESIVNNEKKSIIETNESYTALARELQSYYSTELDWAQRTDYAKELSAITKQDIINFANKHLHNNYVVVNKNQGEDKSIVKVDKPTITPITLNKDVSNFAKAIAAMPESDIKPKFVNYSEDIARAKTKQYEILSVQNKDNDLFRLYYYYNTGSWQNKYLPIALDYINYIGTSKKTAAQFSKELYQLAASFNINAGAENVTISIDGLNENFAKTVALVDDLLKNCEADEASLVAYKARLKQSRTNAKKNKAQIMRGLQQYAAYGKHNPFNNVLSDEELDKLTAKELVSLIKSVFNSEHQVLHYGPQSIANLQKSLPKAHAFSTGKRPVQMRPVPFQFKQVEQTNPTVYFANYDMVQTELAWLRNGIAYNSNLEAKTRLFNEYFGGGMGSIVFQTIRESKALAYSTYSYISNPMKAGMKYNVVSYVGTQADKVKDASKAMNELMTDLPQNPSAFNTAKTSLLKTLATNRTQQEGIIFSYINAEKFGRDYDINEKVFSEIQNVSISDITTLHKEFYANKPFTYCIVGNKNNADMKTINSLGNFQELSLEEIFGY